MKEQMKSLQELEAENDELRKKISKLEANELRRKKAEEALKASERRFKAIADYTYEWECWHSPEGRLMWVNPAVERMTGYTAEECMVMTDYPFCLVHPDEKESCRNNFYEAVSKKTIGTDYHFRIVHKNGTFRWMSISWQSIYDENGGWLGFRSSIRDITRRKEDEAKLRASEEKYKTLFNTSPYGVAALSLDGLFIDANEACCKLLGYKFEDLKVIGFESIAPGKWSELSMSILNPTSENPNPGSFDLDLESLNGNIFPVSLTGWVIKNTSGEPSQICLIMTDISERKEAEKALRKSEKEYRELVQNARAIILRMDMKGNISFFNEYASDFFGFSEEDILGKNVIGTIVPPTDSAGNDLTAMIEDILRNPERHSINENENVRKNGETVWISWSNRNIFDKNGNTIEILCAGTDITERKKAEKALQESENRFRGIVEQSADGIFLSDVNGRIVEWNYACENILGLMKSDVLGKHVWDVWAVISTRNSDFEERRNDLKMVLSEYITTGISPWGGQVLEEKIIRPDGSSGFVQELAFLIKTTEGNVGCAIIRDVTSLRVAEERARLQEQQLIQADKMASLGILVSGVAHEINNPNNFIMLNGEILLKVWDSVTPILEEHYLRNGEFSVGGIPYSKAHERVGKLIKGIKEGAERIEKIVSGLKAFTRQDSGDMNEILDMNSIVESAVLIVNNLLKKTTVKFTTSLGDGIPKVRGNFQRLEQVLINLLANACQAVHDRNSGISVKTYFDNEKNIIITEIADEGIGISPEDMPHIMDPFFTTKRDSGGTGLGLSISYNFIKEHGGELRLDSVPGKGTTASILLPPLKES